MKLAGLSILICLPFFSHAQSQVELNPITITSSLQPIPASRTGRNITSISGESFHKLPVHSLDELLRYVPGVEVQQRGPAGSQADIVLRGGTFQQVLIILDGLRLNDPNTGHFNAYIPIAPVEIERIEILKGAASAIYGSEAVGGVIHIITKAFAAKKNQAKKQLAVEGTAGEYQLFNASAGGFFQQKNTAVGAGILTNNSIGQQQRGQRGFFNNHTGSISLKQFISDKWSIAIRSGYDERKFGAQNFYTTFVSDTANEKVVSNWNQAAIQFAQGKHTVTLDAGYKNVQDLFQYNSRSTPNNNRSKLLQLLLSDHYQLSDKTAISTGLQYQNKHISSNDRGSHTVDHAAAFVVLNQQWKKFSMSPSVRIDHNELRGTEFVPQINLSYNVNKWQLRASAGKTIRDADFTERYNNYNKAFVSGGSIGNPGLVAERSFSYEAGTDYFAGKNLKLSASVFQRRQSDLIDFITTPYANMPRKTNLSPTGTYALATNIAKVTTSGLEMDVQFNKTFNNQHAIASTLGLLWMDSKGSNTTPSFYISSHAKFLTNFSFEYSNNIFALSSTGIYKHRTAKAATAIQARVNADFFMMNSKLSVFVWKKKAAVFVEVDNMFDKVSSDLLGTQLPGRWLMVGMKLNIK